MQAKSRYDLQWTVSRIIEQEYHTTDVAHHQLPMRTETEKGKGQVQDLQKQNFSWFDVVGVVAGYVDHG